MAKPTIQQVARAFFEQPELALPPATFPLPVSPATQLYFVKDQGVFFVRASRGSPDAPETIAPFDDQSSPNDASDFQELLFRFTTLNFPELSATPALLRDLRHTLYTAAPQKLTSLTTKVILFKDCAFSFEHLTFIERTPDLVSPLAFNFSISDIEASHSPDLPTFQAFISRAFPEFPEEAIQYFLTLIGYLLTPSQYLTQIPAFFYLYGETGAGKSVFLDLVESLFPPYLKSSISLESLTTNKFAVANLAGKQLNIVDEDESEYVSGGKIKSLTSFRPVDAERKYEQSFRLYPQTKFIVASNHLPTLKNMDAAVERRLHLVTFSHTIPEPERDPNLAKKLIQESPVIVLKALQAITNLLRSANQVFALPKAFKEARHEFLVESTSPLSFIEECFEIVTTNPEDTCYANGPLYTDYLSWCESKKKIPFAQMKFFATLKSIPNLISTRTGHSGERGKNLRKKPQSTSRANTSSLL